MIELKRRSFRAQALARRKSACARVQSRIKLPLTLQTRKRDPLTRPTHSALGSGAIVALFFSGAILLHALALGVFLLVGNSMVGFTSSEPLSERIEVRMVEPPPPEVTEPEPPPAPEPQPEPEETELPPDPVNAVETVPEPIEANPVEPENLPRRIVGLSLESTVVGGSGPSFAVGNTRMGKTADKAEDPEQVETPKKKIVWLPEHQAGMSESLNQSSKVMRSSRSIPKSSKSKESRETWWSWCLSASMVSSRRPRSSNHRHTLSSTIQLWQPQRRGSFFPRHGAGSPLPPA